MSRPLSPSLSRRTLLKGAALAGAALLCHAPARLLAAVPSGVHTQTKLLMGTTVTLSLVHPNPQQASEAFERTFAEMARLEALLSRYDSTSPLSVLNAQGRLLDAPVELLTVMDRARRVHSLTSGAFDMTVAPVLDLFRAHSNPRGSLRLDPQALAHARELVAAEDIFLAPDHVRLGRTGMALTLDGIAKGYIVDQASALLSRLGMVDHLINAGGDIRASGLKAPGQFWRVGIEHPAQKNTVAEVLPLSGAIATSGSYEVYYDATREHHHLIDPVSKASPRHIVSVSVTAPSTIEADALATALSVMTEADALRCIRSLPGRQCCLLTRQGTRVVSAGWGKA